VFLVCEWLVGEGLGKDLSGAFMGTIIGRVVIWAPGLLSVGSKLQVSNLGHRGVNGIICWVGFLVDDEFVRMGFSGKMELLPLV
jgi:hypothetical protein